MIGVGYISLMICNIIYMNGCSGDDSNSTRGNDDKQLFKDLALVSENISKEFAKLPNIKIYSKFTHIYSELSVLLNKYAANPEESNDAFATAFAVYVNPIAADVATAFAISTANPALSSIYEQDYAANVAFVAKVDKNNAAFTANVASAKSAESNAAGLSAANAYTAVSAAADNPTAYNAVAAFAAVATVYTVAANAAKYAAAGAYYENLVFEDLRTLFDKFAEICTKLTLKTYGGSSIKYSNCTKVNYSYNSSVIPLFKCLAEKSKNISDNFENIPDIFRLDKYLFVDLYKTLSEFLKNADDEKFTAFNVKKNYLYSSYGGDASPGAVAAVNAAAFAILLYNSAYYTLNNFQLSFSEALSINAADAADEAATIIKSNGAYYAKESIISEEENAEYNKLSTEFKEFANICKEINKYLQMQQKKNNDSE